MLLKYNTILCGRVTVCDAYRTLLVGVFDCVGLRGDFCMRCCMSCRAIP